MRLKGLYVLHNIGVIMAIVIHTRKEKYQYAYEHTRVDNKVVSRYMYPVNVAGVRVEPYHVEVAQQGWNKVTADVYKKDDNLFIQKGYNPQIDKYIISYGDRSQPKSIKTKIVNTKKEANIFIKKYINKKIDIYASEHKEVAQQRKIVISKPSTVEGTKEIEVRRDPFINNTFDPVGETYIIKKYKDEKEWHVYKKGKYMGGKEGYRKENTYIGTDTLKNCKKYCKEKL